MVSAKDRRQLNMAQVSSYRDRFSEVYEVAARSKERLDHIRG